jgi:hypothetical protein
MKKPVLYNSNMEFEHHHWIEEITFWKDELKSFNNRLSELITRWENKEVLAQIGNYQKDFIFHEDLIEDLLEAIKHHETRISTHHKAGTLGLDKQLSAKHIEFRNQIEAQRENYAELKKEFFRFLEKSL